MRTSCAPRADRAALARNWITGIAWARRVRTTIPTPCNCSRTSGERFTRSSMNWEWNDEGVADRGCVCRRVQGAHHRRCERPAEGSGRRAEALVQLGAEYRQAYRSKLAAVAGDQAASPAEYDRACCAHRAQSLKLVANVEVAGAARTGVDRRRRRFEQASGGDLRSHRSGDTPVRGCGVTATALRS